MNFTGERNEPNAHAARIVLASRQRWQLILTEASERRTGYAAKAKSFTANSFRSGHLSDEQEQAR